MRKVSYAKALELALYEEMKKDSSIYYMGQPFHFYSRRKLTNQIEIGKARKGNKTY